MKRKISRRQTFIVSFLLLVLTLPASRLFGRVLDNFDDNTKTDWKDFTFVPGFGLPKEAGGQFQFELPPAGQSIFTGSQKTSETFELREGRTIEFRADVIQGGAKDSFAVLAFLPTANSPGTLSGYGMAKSTTDILITKGINRYFVNDPSPAAQVKNENITLVLSLTAQGGNVTINAKVLDKDNNNAVLWERTVVDTPAADVFADGQDSPAAPFLTGGYFTLYCYQDFDPNAPEDPYRVYYDNAQVFVTETTALDNFDDNTKTDWKDFTFVPGFGLPKEANGQFQFEMPPAGQSIFSASQKTSRVFDLVNGEQVEFRADVVQAGGKDSFAILAFLPTANSPGTLAGYGLAKSTTDILITKGINRYFVNDDSPAAQVKNENITLILSLSAQGGNVTITAKVLDKSNNNAVLWQRTVVDTPAADVFADGQDSPAEPFLTGGYFTLYCYQDFDRNAPEDPYRVYYDNAIVSAAPLAANTAPIIADVAPAEFASFLPTNTRISFKVTDDKPINDDRIAITLNGTKVTTVNGLTVTGSGNSKVASLGGLAANATYSAVLSAEDSEGLLTSQTLYFDTFSQSNMMIETEDFNFESGKFIDNPIPIAEGSGPQANAYSQQTGVQDIDFNETRPAPRSQDTLYRPNDPIRMQHSRDTGRTKFLSAGGPDSGIFDYDVGDIAAGEWLNYTRTFPAGTYEIYLRQALANMNSGESVLELVTGDRAQANPATRVLGSFLGERTGFQYRNFPLTDGTGKNKIIVRLSGVTTLRLRQVTPDPADGARYQNYIILIPVADPGLQRATVSSLFPNPGTAIESVAPVLRIEIQNRDTTVRRETIKLEYNGQPVTSAISGDANGAVVTYVLTPLPKSGAANAAKISFKDNTDFDITSEWNFTVSYISLDPANRRTGAGPQRGLRLRLVQAPAGSSLANELQRAEDQLAPNSTIPSVTSTNTVVQVVNFAEDDRVSGYVPNETIVPGLDTETNGSDDFAVEITGWLDLPAGPHRFGVVSDDGYKISSGRSLSDKEPVLSHRNGGTADQVFEFVVAEPGLYPFRMIWYERGGNAYAEWVSIDRVTGARTLINDPNSAQAIKAYLDVALAPTVQLESAAAVHGPYAVESGATMVVNADTGTIRVRTSGSARFYRLRFGGPPGNVRVTNVKIEGADVVLSYRLTTTP